MGEVVQSLAMLRVHAVLRALEQAAGKYATQKSAKLNVCILYQPTTQAAKTEASSTDGSTKKAVATDVTTPQGEFIQGSTTSHILVKTTESK